MAKSANQKLKLLYIVKILDEETDEQHCMSTQQLIEELGKYDISAERKSIYNDIEQLMRFGYDIVYVKARAGGGYYLAGRQFELAELKLLADAVQSSRFLTLKKSRDLIRKIEKLAGKHGAKQLRRQVYVAGRIKTENESVYYNVDHIHRAIGEDCQIRFRYLEWTPARELKPRRNGEKYQVSPWALTCKDENYYLVAYDGAGDKIKHYRVDKMDRIELAEGAARAGADSFRQFDIAAYTNRTFGMFGGEETRVVLEMPGHMVGIALDRFGREIDIRRKALDGDGEGEERFLVRVEAAVSSQFFGWVTGLGKEVRIVSPEGVAGRYRDYLAGILGEYGN